MLSMHTPRLTLTPATAQHVAWEMADTDALAHALAADIPPTWPPDMLRDALPFFHRQLETHPDLCGWLGWYGVVHSSHIDSPNMGRPVLAASGGFMGLPDDTGTAEMGYSVLPEFQGHGYATEMMAALLSWAFAHPPLIQVAAEALPGNHASQHVLLKLGFAPNGTAHEPGHLRYVLRRP